jgi:predicted small lipoprotein YifL
VIRRVSLSVLASVSLMLALSLGGCGQRGPLYLPDKQKTEAPPDKPVGAEEPATPTGDPATTPESDKTPPPDSEDEPDDNADDKSEHKPAPEKPTAPR